VGWFFWGGGKTLSLAALFAYPFAVVGVVVGAFAQFLWRAAQSAGSGSPKVVFARVPSAAKWGAMLFGLGGLALTLGWLYRPYSLGWLELLGAVVNSLPYAFLLSLLGGATVALAAGEKNTCGPRP